MRTEAEIIKKRSECFLICQGKLQDENEECEANYYSGAWYALLWVLEEEEDI